jgi:hypothetical protein
MTKCRKQCYSPYRTLVSLCCWDKRSLYLFLERLVPLDSVQHGIELLCGQTVLVGNSGRLLGKVFDQTTGLRLQQRSDGRQPTGGQHDHPTRCITERVELPQLRLSQSLDFQHAFAKPSPSYVSCCHVCLVVISEMQNHPLRNTVFTYFWIFSSFTSRMAALSISTGSFSEVMLDSTRYKNA